MTKEYSFQSNHNDITERANIHAEKSVDVIKEKNKKQITVFVCSCEKHKQHDMNFEHSTYVDYNGKCMTFYTDGYNGTSSNEIIGFLKFLGFEIFIVYSDRYTGKSEKVNYRDFLEGI